MKKVKRQIRGVAEYLRQLLKRRSSKQANQRHANARVEHFQKALETAKTEAAKDKYQRKLALWLARRNSAHRGLLRVVKDIRFQRKKIRHLKNLWRKLKAEELAKSQQQSGVAYFDGKPVAAWIKPWLDRSRAAGWHGVLVSGWRSPEYSEQLCFRICDKPTCSGTCAGRTSHHTQSAYPGGAVDVSDYWTFAAVQRRIGSPLYNNLPSDRVHFSSTGN